jgi:hypothetical protein
LPNANAVTLRLLQLGAAKAGAATVAATAAVAARSRFTLFILLHPSF